MLLCCYYAAINVSWGTLYAVQCKHHVFLITFSRYKINVRDSDSITYLYKPILYIIANSEIKKNNFHKRKYL